MKLKRILIAALAATVPLPATTQDWSGPFVGAQLGYSDQEVDGGGISFSGDGTVFGIFAGYDYDFGQFVLGGELEYVIGDYDITSVAPPSSTGFESLTRAKARLGYDTGQFLPYAVIGWGWLNTSGGTDFDGAVFGIGADFAVTSNVSAGLEILRHDLDDGSAGGFETDPVTVSARFSYRF